MIFIIDNLKYNTDKMELVSTKCKYSYSEGSLLCNQIRYSGKNVKIFKSLKNHWLLTYETYYKNCAVALSEEEAKEYLMNYDLETYEKHFGELEEA
jgi:hypothetical protein